MVVFSIKVSNSNPATIVIGRRGTYNTQEVTFDLSYLVENYGNGTAVLMLKRSQDISAYPAVASQANNVLAWTVSDADTYYVGNGEAQLMWYVNDGLAKTIIYPMVVMRDIIGTTEDPPSGYENWIEHLVDLGEETLENAQAAEQSATNAANSAVEADNSATSAETSATTAEAAKDAAELYKNGAETAKTAAETAQSNAEIAQGKAEDAQASAEDSADRAEAALAEFTTPTASATTLSPDASATASYANGHFTFGIPKGNKGDPGAPGAPGVTPDFSIGTVETLQPTQQATASVTGTPEHPVLNLGIPKGEQGDPATNLVQSVNGKTGAVVLDSGDIAYESTTVESELGTINSALSSLSAVTEIIDTASGAIASFPDGSGLPMRSLVAQINPVQDLHGYDAPWPAGGGKNKLEKIVASAQTVNGVTFTPLSDGSVQVSGTATSTSVTVNFTFPLAAGTYTISCTATAGDNITGVQLNSNNVTRDGKSVTFEHSGGNVEVRCRVSSGVTVNEIWKCQIEAGSTVTAWSPYKNICPISGWTGVSGQRTGANIWGGETLANDIKTANQSAVINTENHTVSYVGNAASDVRFTNIPFKENTQYTIILKFSNTVARTNMGVVYTDGTVQFIPTAETGLQTLAFTTTSGKTLDYIKGYASNGTTVIYYDETGVFEGVLTASDFTPYTGEAISATFPSTVYGGQDEVIGGNGISTMGMVDLGTLTWNVGTTNTEGKSRYWALVEGIKQTSGVTALPSIISSQYVGVTLNENYACKEGVAVGSGNDRVWIYDAQHYNLTADQFKAYMSGVQLCYELATPQTFNHEGQSVDTLVGQNNVFVDTGDVSVTYQANLKGYIDKVLAS